MKKILITLIFAINLTLSWKDGNIEIGIGQLLKAQTQAQQMAAYLNSVHYGGSNYIYFYRNGNSASGTVYRSYMGFPPSEFDYSNISMPNTWYGGAAGPGFTNWLSNLSPAFSSAITGFLDGMTGGGENGPGGEEYDGFGPMPDGFGYDPGDPNSIDMFLNDPMFNPDPNIVGPDGMYIYENLDDYYNYYTGNFTVDCQGVVNGVAQISFCGLCTGGNTNTFCPDTTLPRIDTVKATKIICDSLALARGARLTSVFDSVAALADMQRLRDSAYLGMYESGLSITHDSGYGTFNFNTGVSLNVEIVTHHAAHNIVACTHTHVDVAANSPTPGDLYHLINGALENANYFADYVLAHDSTEWAIMITDTVLASAFITQHIRDSTLLQGEWSKININPLTGNDYYRTYRDYMVDLFNNMNYPIEMVQGYGNVEMFKSLNTGVKMYRKDDGSFKELSSTTTTDPATGNRLIEIKICQ